MFSTCMCLITSKDEINVIIPKIHIEQQLLLYIYWNQNLEIFFYRYLMETWFAYFLHEIDIYSMPSSGTQHIKRDTKLISCVNRSIHIYVLDVYR